MLKNAGRVSRSDVASFLKQTARRPVEPIQSIKRESSARDSAISGMIGILRFPTRLPYRGVHESSPPSLDSSSFHHLLGIPLLHPRAHDHPPHKRCQPRHRRQTLHRKVCPLPLSRATLIRHSLQAALSSSHRSGLGITHVLSVCPEHPAGPEDNNHLCIPVQDSEFENLLVHLPIACRFIQDAIDVGGRVLVHCVMGISRSATVICAYRKPPRPSLYPFVSVPSSSLSNENP